MVILDRDAVSWPGFVKLLGRVGDLNTNTVHDYPLHMIAVQNRNMPLEVLAQFFERGADPNAVDLLGNSAMHFILDFDAQFEQKVELLLDAGWHRYDEIRTAAMMATFGPVLRKLATRQNVSAIQKLQQLAAHRGRWSPPGKLVARRVLREIFKY
jgi:hypothetical protein